MAKVESIIDPEFKSGYGKNNKKWTLIKIQADGKTATGFGPVAKGDEVDLEYNDQYNSWGFKRIGPQEIPTIQVEPPPEGSQKLLELIYDDTQHILKLLDKTPPKTLKESWDETTKEDTVVEDIGDEPINLDSIPF